MKDLSFGSASLDVALASAYAFGVSDSSNQSARKASSQCCIANATTLMAGLFLVSSCQEPEEQLSRNDSAAVDAGDTSTDRRLSTNVVRSHPLLSPQARSQQRSADMLSRVDADGYGWAVEEGMGETEDGRQQRFSGLVGTKTVWSSPERRAFLNRNKPARPNKGERPVRSPASKVDPALLAEDTSPDPLVMIRLAKVDRGTLADQMNQLMLSGDIEHAEELPEWRRTLTHERSLDIAGVQRPVRDFIESHGGQVLHEHRALFAMNAVLPKTELEALAALPEVELLSAPREVSESAITGNHVINGTQIKQFIDAGFDGENGGSADSYVAVVELRRLREEHRGVREGSGTSNRISSKWSCDGSGCNPVNNWTIPTGNHATAVAGLVLGDLRDGQDPSVPGAAGRRSRSGYAGEARLHMYRNNDGSTAALREALDHIATTASPQPRFVNFSLHAIGDDPACEGESALSRDANDLFEMGTLMIASAGNEGHPNLNDCRVDAPGSAIGVFTVAAHGSSWNETEAAVAGGGINAASSMGGSRAQGEGRTIIDISAYACRTRLFNRHGGYDWSACGTSFATPTVTAAAIDFASWYRDFNNSSFIDNPGVMFAALLLQGDRQQQSSTLMTSEFSPLWGAGRLKMRKGDPAGMDAPYLWRFGSTCVGDGQEKIISVNGGATLPNDVDDIKAVAYWYDPQHEVGITIDDIDLFLENTSGTVLRSSNGSYDNKERVFRSGAGGTAYQLRLVGADVTYDNSASCGENSMLVYYSFFYEDDDRDDGNGPPLSEIDPE